jgi:hypothetical protein
MWWTSAGDLRVRPLYHGSVMLEFGGKVIHVDPWSMGDYTGLPPADMIVITHTHADHLDRTMEDKLHKPGTLLVPRRSLRRSDWLRDKNFPTDCAGVPRCPRSRSRRQRCNKPRAKRKPGESRWRELR